MTSAAGLLGCLSFPNHHHLLWSHFRGDFNIIVAITLLVIVVAIVLLVVSIVLFVVVHAIALFGMLWLH